MLTIFALPKPFQGEFNIIQRNAIKSWTLLSPKPEIILFEDEKETTKKIAEEVGAIYVSEVEKNEFGTPLVSDIFRRAQNIASNDILCYVNADIILMQDFMEAIGMVKNEENFLMVGQRTDFDLNEKIDFENTNWEEKLRGKIQKEGKLHPVTGIDYFVFKKGLWNNIPPFAIGRTIWDEWLLWRAWKNGGKIIDATQVVTAIHQNHSYFTKNGKKFNPWKTEEAKINLKLGGGYEHCFTIDDATHILTEDGLKEVPKTGILRRLEIIPYLGFFVRQRRKIFKFIKK